MYKLATLFILICVSPGFATDFVVPKQSIVKPAGPVPVGEEAEVGLTPTGPLPPYLNAVTYTWKVLDAGKEKKIHKAEDGVGIFFAVGVKKKTVQVFVFIQYLYIVREDDDPKKPIVEVSTRNVFLADTVLIGEDEPVPPVPPPAPVDPDPVFPVTKFDIAKLVWKGVMDGVPPANRAGTARAMAASYRVLAKDIKSNKYPTNTAILEATAAANSKILGDLAPQWESVGEIIGNKLYSLSQARSLRTVDEYADCWQEIADALEKVK